MKDCKGRPWSLLRSLSLFLNYRQIVMTSDAPEFEPGNIFCPLFVTQHYTVFLKVVSNAGNVSNMFLSIRETDKNTLPVGRVRFLWFLDQGLDDDSFHLRSFIQRMSSLPWFHGSSLMNVDQFSLFLPFITSDYICDVTSRLITWQNLSRS